MSVSIGILVALALSTGLLIKYCLLSKKSISSSQGNGSWLTLEMLQPFVNVFNLTSKNFIKVAEFRLLVFKILSLSL